MIAFCTSVEGIEADQLKGFFVGWPNPPSCEKHLQILKNSYKIILAIDSENDNVVGFINAVGDDIMSAYIPLLEVLPEYQKRGIGQELVKRMLSELNGLYMIDLVCDKNLVAFYEKLGMETITAMMVRNFERQSCS
jgi:ribosomal protein S18 acetylase RimI-like enzyme